MRGDPGLELVHPSADSVYTVSRLTQEIKSCLEGTFPGLRVEGEISNFRVPSSGHYYFTLKDAYAQIRAVMFRSRNHGLPFIPEDGMHVICSAALSVYPPRGEYQLVVEWMEPRGQGALQAAFEALKRRLAEEGLFDPGRKKPVPYLPRRVGLVTSPSGAAIRDFLRILWRRFPGVEVRLCPVRVQGAGAAEEIVEAIRALNAEGLVEVIVLARGGGSLEDLWAFNEEIVARAVAASDCPVVSAVGHEIDFTIADFAADLRAPTPSAAAELLVPEKAALEEALRSLRDRLSRAAAKSVGRSREVLFHLSKRLVHPGRRVRDHLLRLDELEERMRASVRRKLAAARTDRENLETRLFLAAPVHRIRTMQLQVDSLGRILERAALHAVEARRLRWKEAAGRLDSLNPLAVLSRGYSITRLLPGREILRSAECAAPGAGVEVILARGRLACRVEEADPRQWGPGEPAKGPDSGNSRPQ